MNSAVGRAHHIATQMDRRFNITAGCFSTNEVSNSKTASYLGIPRSRLYGDWRELLAAETSSLDALLLLTPTPLHAEMAVAALHRGFPVICEKALAVSSAEAREICRARDENNGFVAVTYNYSGYPMIRELRHLVEKGLLGRVTSVMAEMPQEGFSRLIGATDSKPQPQAWRLIDHSVPTVSLDLGVHLHHLIDFLIRKKPVELCATQHQRGHFANVVDDVQCLARYTDDVAAHLWFGKTALGYANGLRIRLFGTEGSAEWLQMNPENLLIADNKGHSTVITRSTNGLTICNQDRYSRFKAGHPAGFVEAFANYYFDVADSLSEFRVNQRLNNPYVAGAEIAEEGLRMMEAIASSARERCWREI